MLLLMLLLLVMHLLVLLVGHEQCLRRHWLLRRT
jgi:hypothetical protein